MQSRLAAGIMSALVREGGSEALARAQPSGLAGGPWHVCRTRTGDSAVVYCRGKCAGCVRGYIVVMTLRSLFKIR